MNIQHLPGDIHLIDDTYNANPASLYSALQVLAVMVEQDKPGYIVNISSMAALTAERT